MTDRRQADGGPCSRAADGRHSRTQRGVDLLERALGEPVAIESLTFLPPLGQAVAERVDQHRADIGQQLLRRREAQYTWVNPRVG